MSESTGYHVYDFERGQWWKENKYGYTSKLSEAGKFEYEDALSIVKNSNVVKIESEMVHHKDLERLLSITDEIGVKEKPSIDSVISQFTGNNQYFKTNPLGKIIESLGNAGHYYEDINIPHVDYETNSKVDLINENGRDGLRINLYRMPSGNYEVTINNINPNLSYENDTLKKNRKTQKP
mgnify:CR=1 FL=1